MYYCRLCILAFVLGNAANFTNPDTAGGFWPKHEGPKGGLVRMYEGGIVVPVLIRDLSHCCGFYY